MGDVHTTIWNGTFANVASRSDPRFDGHIGTDTDHDNENNPYVHMLESLDRRWMWMWMSMWGDFSIHNDRRIITLLFDEDSWGKRIF